MELMPNLETWSLVWLFLLGTGWYGGGSSALHDHTDAISNGGPLGVNTVTTGQVKTATGLVTSAVSATIDVVLNDYSWFPGITSNAHDILDTFLVADPGDTVGRFAIASTGTFHCRWRYLTASDRPTIWVVADPVTGKLLAVWSSDDPTPKNVPGVRLADRVTGLPIGVPQLMGPADLAALNLPAGALVVADAYIAANKLNPANRLYRALQEHAGDPAPAQWLLDNCQLDGNGTLTLTAVGLLEVAAPEPVPTLSRLAQIWSRFTTWFIP